MVVKIVIFAIIWVLGAMLNIISWEKIRDYKCYDNPKVFLYLGIMLSFIMSWALVYLSIINNQFELPNWLYHNCMKHSSITFKDIDYDKNGNIMEEYDSNKFGHRETYRIYTCKICGKIVKQERLQ